MTRSWRPGIIIDYERARKAWLREPSAMTGNEHEDARDQITQLLLRAALRLEIADLLAEAPQWLKTPHELLGGQTPDERIEAGDINTVRNLLYSIIYVGVS